MKDECLTNLIVSGEKKIIERMKKRFFNYNFLMFEKVIPLPKDIKKSITSSDAKSNHQFIEWATENWGTSDFPQDQYCEEDKYARPSVEKEFKDFLKFRLYYTTDKTPAKQIVSKLAELFPDLTFVHNCFSTDTHEALHEVYENGDLVESTVPEWEEFAQNEFDYFVEDEENQPLPFTSNQREYD